MGWRLVVSWLPPCHGPRTRNRDYRLPHLSTQCDRSAKAAGISDCKTEQNRSIGMARVFVSFAIEDRDLRTLLVGQRKNARK